jgi:hypothetical protein
LPGSLETIAVDVNGVVLGRQSFLDQGIFKPLEVGGRVATEPSALRTYLLAPLQASS